MEELKRLLKKPKGARIISYAANILLVVLVVFAFVEMDELRDDAIMVMAAASFYWVILEIIAYIVTIIYNIRNKSQNERICERCGKKISGNSPYCPYCGHKKGGEPNAAQLTCPHCGSPVNADMVYCEQCGTALRGQVR